LFFKILLDNNITPGIRNSNLTEEQKYFKEFMDYKHEDLKNSMTALIIFSSDNSVTQSFLNIFQKTILIFGSLVSSQARDSYLSDLCKLAIPNNLENTIKRLIKTTKNEVMFDSKLFDNYDENLINFVKRPTRESLRELAKEIAKDPTKEPIREIARDIVKQNFELNLE